MKFLVWDKVSKISNRTGTLNLNCKVVVYIFRYFNIYLLLLFTKVIQYKKRKRGEQWKHRDRH